MQFFKKTFPACLSLLALVALACFSTSAQEGRSGALPARAQQPRVATPATPSTPPQVVTVIHRLNGMKVLRMLRRAGGASGGSVEVEDQTFVTRDVHTTILAGFALGDGRTIVARLPEAVAEVETATGATGSGGSSNVNSSSTSNVSEQPEGTMRVTRTVSADISVLRGDGQQIPARYIGWDGATGLSLIQIGEPFQQAPRDAAEASIKTGQRVRLVAPLPSRRPENSTPNSLSLRIAEIYGEIVKANRGPMNKLTGLVVRGQELSQEMVGGVALNDAGETLGIVESADGQEAHVIPVSVIRRAAERVIARRSSVPRPLLGVRGEAVSSTTLSLIQSKGWSHDESLALKAARQGILVTDVTPGTPAALANLLPGDIIWQVGDTEIRSAEDFSFTLGEAGSGASLLFTVLRGLQPNAQSISQNQAATTTALPQAPQMPSISLAELHLPQALATLKPMSFRIQLGEMFEPAIAMPGSATGMSLTAAPVIVADPWINYGLETITIGERTAQRYGARSGLLIVSVEPHSPAFEAGLMSNDVLESLNGKLLPLANALFALPETTRNKLKLSVVRDRRTFEVVLPSRPQPPQ